MLQKGFSNNHQAAWNEENFQALEKALTAYKNSGLRTYPDGFSTQQLFYQKIAEAGLEGTDQAFEQRIQDWMKVYPHSVTPYSVLAHYYLLKGWKARGEGYMKDVTQSGYETLQQYLAKGLLSLETAEKNKILTDAHFYLERLQLLKGVSSTPPDEIQQAFLAGQKKDPNYFPLYELMANILLYRWHGDSDDLRLFAKWAANNPDQTASPDVMYAHIAESIANSLLIEGGNGSMDEFLSYEFDWPKIRSGFFQEGQYYPMTTLRYDLLCRMAVAYNDAPTAKAVFDNLQNTSYRRVWGQRDSYNAARAWAKATETKVISTEKVPH